MHMIFFISFFLYTQSCQKAPGSQRSSVEETLYVKRNIDLIKPENQNAVDYDTTQWVELTAKDGYVIDIKYATTDNFVKEAVYPCGRCFLKPAAAKSISIIRDKLAKEGYKLKFYDCYRPRPVQQKLWDKVPNPNYVAPPSEGSMHNRGVAVDLTITDKDGKELDMGTAYDFFGPAAHHNCTQLKKSVLDNRKKLKTIMEAHGFGSIRTEWWHYSYRQGSYPLYDWQWTCDN